MHTTRKKQQTKRRKIRINKLARGGARGGVLVRAIGELTPDGQIIYKYDEKLIDNAEKNFYILDHDDIPKDSKSQNAIINIGAPGGEEMIHPSTYIGSFAEGFLNDGNGTLKTTTSTNIQYKFEGGIHYGKKHGRSRLYVNVNDHRSDNVTTQYDITYKNDNPVRVNKVNLTAPFDKTSKRDFIMRMLAKPNLQPQEKVEDMVGWTKVERRRRRQKKSQQPKPETVTISIYLHGEDVAKRVKHDRNVNCRLLSTAGETCTLAFENHTKYAQEVYDIITHLGYSILKSGEIPAPHDPTQVSTFKYLEILQRVINAYGNSPQSVNAKSARPTVVVEEKDDYYLDKGGKIINPVVEHNYTIDSDDLGDETGIFIHNFESSQTTNILLDILQMIYMEKKVLFLGFLEYIRDIIDKNSGDERLSRSRDIISLVDTVKNYNYNREFKIIDDTIKRRLLYIPRGTYIDNRNRILIFINQMISKINIMGDFLDRILEVLEMEKPENATLTPLTTIALSDVIRFFSPPNGNRVILNAIDASCRASYYEPNPDDKDLLHLRVAEKQGLTALSAYGGKRKTRKTQ